MNCDNRWVGASLGPGLMCGGLWRRSARVQGTFGDVWAAVFECALVKEEANLV